LGSRPRTTRHTTTRIAIFNALIAIDLGGVARGVDSDLIREGYDDLLNRFLGSVTFLEELSRRVGVRSIDREDGFVLASLSYYVAMLGGRVFIDAGAGVGYSTSWMLYGIAGTVPRGKISLYAVERDSRRYGYLKENVEKLGSLLFGEGSLVELITLNEDVVGFLEREGFEIDMIFVDIDKKQYIDVLRILPEKLSRVGLGIFHNALIPGLDEETREFLKKQKQLTHHVIPTPLGLLIVKRTT